jgi:adenosine deaminase
MDWINRKAEEWDSLAKWICDNKLYSDHNRWMIQVPRIYTLFKKTNQIKNFGELIQSTLASPSSFFLSWRSVWRAWT